MTYHQKLNVFVIACTFVIAGGLALLGYWQFLDGTVVRPVVDNTHHTEYETVQQEYEPGDVVTIKSKSFCKYRNVPAKMYVTLVDTIMLNYPVEEISVPAGCYEGKELTLKKLPLFLSRSTYRFEGYVEYEINPMRSVIVPFHTTSFEVPKEKIQIIK